MEFDNQLKLGHLLLVDRKCRSCGEIKNFKDGIGDLINELWSAYVYDKVS